MQHRCETHSPLQRHFHSLEVPLLSWSSCL
jgi:hypothetical protein